MQVSYSKLVTEPSAPAWPDYSGVKVIVLKPGGFGIVSSIEDKKPKLKSFVKSLPGFFLHKKPDQLYNEEALLAVLDHRYKLIEYNKVKLGITHAELQPAFKALVTFDLERAVYLLYGYGLKACAYLRLPEIEAKVKYWKSISEIPHDFSVQMYGNNGLIINQPVPYLPHELTPHTGKVVQMPYGGYGYGLHKRIGQDKRLPVVPYEGRQQTHEKTLEVRYCSYQVG